MVDTRIKVKAVAVALVAILVVSAWAADESERAFYIEEKVESVAPAGQRAPSGIVKTWVRGQKMRTESSSGEIIIYRADLRAAWMLHTPSKTYVEVASAQLAQMGLQSLSLYGSFQDGRFVMPDPLFQPTGRTRTVGAWSCDEYEVTAKPTLGPHVATKTTQCLSAKFPLGVEDLVHVFRLSAGGESVAAIEEFLGRVKALPGYPIEQKTVTTASLQTLSTTKSVIKVEKTRPNAAMFELPEGYTKINPPTMPRP